LPEGFADLLNVFRKIGDKQTQVIAVFQGHGFQIQLSGLAGLDFFGSSFINNCSFSIRARNSEIFSL